MKSALAAVALAFGCATAVLAQGAKWNEPYESALKAFEGGRCAEAIPLLERAVAIDPKAEANKRIEGVFRKDYFPYYYLALCYAAQSQWDKAAQNLDKARSTLTRQQRAKFEETETKIKVAMNPPPNVDPRKATFDAAVAKAESALSNQQYDAALRQFDSLKAGYASEYAAANLGSKRDQAARGVAAQLVEEGRGLVAKQNYNEAKAKFQQADQTLPNQRQVADALTDIKKREDDYQQLKAQGLADFNARNYPSAKEKLEQARQRHPQLFAIDNLNARLNDINNRPPVPIPVVPPPPPPNNGDKNAAEVARIARSAKDFLGQGKYAEADAAYASILKLDPNNTEAADAMTKSKKFKALRDRAEANRSKNVPAAKKALADAKALDADRFAKEGLAAVLDSLNPGADVPPPAVPTPSGGAVDAARVALQQGLTALLDGRAQESISILEAAASKDKKSAPIHAYLGVAYATQALSAPKADERSRLQDKALDQFKLAKAAQSDYQLSSRIVSPAIVSIYQTAKP